ncbi:cell wall hydrolase [Sphingomonas sp. R-74633]|uniref:cell wall hydrolase n=1 Tax=Sphingomonas sp. R-74633 TaxID=2751188 RepID=UPI0015D19E3C|nr:cell wall hydrolase [Sphingomonas sp. R-74633]NYT41647.1 cell wall hydrolase [Sphingomonas sp. R-74633]
MKLIHRVAAFATVTFCAGALANAATLDVTLNQDSPVQMVNSLEHQVVPTPAAQAAPLPIKGEIVQQIPNATADEDFDSLSEAVAAQDAPASLDSELNCLAVSVYYEAKSEPLAGQLAVADVVLNRTESGRFPRSVCGVVTQRGQFSFVRGGKLPTPPANGQWKKALAVAQVAMKEQWNSPVPEALYFHARYVKPSWKRPRVGSVGNHVFYR